LQEAELEFIVLADRHQGACSVKALLKFGIKILMAAAEIHDIRLQEGRRRRGR